MIRATECPDLGHRLPARILRARGTTTGELDLRQGRSEEKAAGLLDPCVVVLALHAGVIQHHRAIPHASVSEDDAAMLVALAAAQGLTR